MLELSVSQAQKQLTSILSETTLVIDKKRHIKKAVIMPYEAYEKLLKNARPDHHSKKLDDFIGILSNSFESNDMRYNDIIK